jgi:hypothetical protein
MPINEEIVSSVAIGNVKTIAEAGAHSIALAMENAVAHQNRMNVIAESAVGNIVKNLTEVDPAQAVAILKATSGNEVAATIAQLAAALASNQQGVKAAQTTPPPTGGIPGV